MVMKSIRTMIVSVSLIAAVLLSLSACSKHSNNFDMDEEHLSGKLRIAIDTGASSTGQVHPLDHSVTGPIYDRLNDFQAKHPDLEIEMIDISFITSQASTIPQDPLPDIMEVVPYQIRWVANPNELENLDTLIQNLGLAAPYEQLIDKTRVNGSAWMLPISNEPVIVYYDEQVFGQLGIPLPDDNWTWDDFISASRRLAEENYMTDIPEGYPDGGFNLVEPIIQGLGGSYASNDGMHFSGYLDSESTVSAFNRYVSDIREQRSRSMSVKGDKALGIGRPSELYYSLKDNMNLRITRMPLFADGKRYNTTYITGLAISSQSTNKAAAEALLKELAGNGEDAVNFANYNALGKRDHRFMDSPPIQQEEMLRVMDLETMVATPSTFQLNPSIIGNYGILYLPPANITDAIKKLFEPDSIEPILHNLTHAVESKFPDQRGKW
jgi:ABC-type sugar transport system, periplasmic component